MLDLLKFRITDATLINTVWHNDLLEYVGKSERLFIDEIKKGDIGVVLGPSGAGKSSILKMILGLWKPDSGCVFIDGTDMCNLKEKDLLNVRKKMGVVVK